MIFTSLTLRWHSDQYLLKTVHSVGRMSDVLNRSMHYSMLLNRREDIFQIIKTVGSEPGIEVARIYNKKGTITFSSKEKEIGTTVHLKNEACTACHANGATIVSSHPADLTRIFNSPSGERILGMITPIKNEASCSNAECHAHPATQTVLGVLDVMVPLKELDESLSELRKEQYISATIWVAIVASFAGIFIWVMVTTPVRKLSYGTEEIRKGNLQHRIGINTNDEIGHLANSFNEMSDELQRARNALTEWTHTLEQRVNEKTEELRRTQANMIQMEKMISLGTLAATVAHELNNPLEGVLTYAKLLQRKIRIGTLTEEEQQEILSELSIIANETSRCGNIVKNLLLFSRQRIGAMSEVHVQQIVKQSLLLIDHHLKMHNIALETQLPDVSLTLLCDPNQIEQALIAIEINAVEAMPDGGTLRISIAEDATKKNISIQICDTGIGIQPDDLPHIFEPFYTTKHDGKGTGLGLAVVYGIIERHGGSVSVASVPQQGSAFTILLPKNNAQAEANFYTSSHNNTF